MEQKGQPEPTNQVQKLARRLQENRQSLHIARVPPKTKEEFVKWAEKEFCSDYGMALKWLWDSIPKADLLSAMEIITDHEDRLLALESQKQKATTPSEVEETKTIKKLDGSKIEVPKNE